MRRNANSMYQSQHALDHAHRTRHISSSHSTVHTCQSSIGTTVQELQAIQSQSQVSSYEPRRVTSKLICEMPRRVLVSCYMCSARIFSMHTAQSSLIICTISCFFFRSRQCKCCVRCKYFLFCCFSALVRDWINTPQRLLFLARSVDRTNSSSRLREQSASLSCAAGTQWLQTLYRRRKSAIESTATIMEPMSSSLQYSCS